MKINFTKNDFIHTATIINNVTTGKINCFTKNRFSADDAEKVIENIFSNFPINPLFLVRTYSEDSGSVVVATDNASKVINAIIDFHSSDAYDALSNLDKNRFDDYRFNVTYSDWDEFSGHSLADHIDYIYSRTI